MSETFADDIVDKWRKMRDDFDRDPSMPNPYEEAENRTVPQTHHSNVRLFEFFRSHHG